MKKITAMLLSLLFVVTCTACSNRIAREPNIAEMTGICEITTIECYYHSVIKFNQENAEKFLFFWTKDKNFWIECGATVKLGIDISSLQIDINGSIITVYLPKAEIQSFKFDPKSLTEDSYVVAKESAKIDSEDQTKAFSKAEEQLKQAISEDKTLLKQVQQKVQNLLEAYIESIEESSDVDYSIEWKYI